MQRSPEGERQPASVPEAELPPPDRLLQPMGLAAAWHRAASAVTDRNTAFVVGICDGTGAPVARGTLHSLQQVQSFARAMRGLDFSAETAGTRACYQGFDLVFVPADCKRG
jgi:hypothetical protein